MDVCPKLTPFSYKQKGPFLQLSARVKFSDCLLDWRKLEKACKIVLHAVGNFLSAFSTRTRIPLLLKEKAILERTARTDFKMLSQKKKTAEPNRKLVSLLLQETHVPCDDDAQCKTRVSVSARCSLPWNAWWLVHAGARATATNE